MTRSTNPPPDNPSYSTLVTGILVMAAVLGCIVAVGWLTAGCRQVTSGADAASYVAGVEQCLRQYPADDCESIVACKQKVQIAHGLAPSGSCDPRDAGAEGGAP